MVTFLIEYTMFKLFLFLLQYSTEIKIIFLYFNFLRFVPKQYTKTKNFCVYFSLFVPKLFKLNLLLILISFQFFSRTKNNLYIPQSPRIRINHITIFCWCLQLTLWTTSCCRPSCRRSSASASPSWPSGCTRARTGDPAWSPVF